MIYVMSQATEMTRFYCTIVFWLEKGKFYDKIELDPRENMQSDEKVDLKSLPQYKGQLSKQ